MRKKNRFLTALNGLAHVFKKERNFKIHLIAFISVIILGWWFQIKAIEWIAILIASVLVLAFEIINTAIEILCDFVHPEEDLKIGRIKDVSAASVLICAMMSGVIGLIVFIPYLMNMFCDSN